MSEKDKHKEKDHMDEKQEKFEKHRVPLDPPGIEERDKGKQEKEHVFSAEDKKAQENARLGIRDDLAGMQKANLEEDKRRREQVQRDTEGLKGVPGAPGQGPLLSPEQQAIAGGETVTISSVTLGSLLSSLYVTNTAPSAPTTATWVAPNVLQGVYGDMSVFTVRFEARAYVPSKIAVT